MKKYFRTIIAAFLLLITTVPIGFTIFSTIRHHVIQREMEKRLETQPLTTIALTSSEIFWLEKDELWINNKLFDVKSCEKKDGLFFFTGIYDEEETSLVEKEKEAARNKGYSRELVTLYEYLAAFSPPSSQEMGSLTTATHRYPQKSDRPVHRCAEILPRPPRSGC